MLPSGQVDQDAVPELNSRVHVRSCWKTLFTMDLLSDGYTVYSVILTSCTML